MVNVPANGSRGIVEPAPEPQEIVRPQDEVRTLVRERNAIILAHNYQRPEVATAGTEAAPSSSSACTSI